MIIRRLPQLARSISTTPPLLAGSRLTRHRPPVRRVLKPSFSAATAQHAVAPASSSGSAAGTSSPTSTPPATATEGNAAAPTALKEVVSTGLPEPPATAPTLPLVARIPVEVPHDELGVIDQAQGEWAEQVRTLFATPAIVVARQLEMMNVLLGFEEANKYQLLSPEGHLLGYLAEEDLGLRGALTRNMLKTHRAFRATVLAPDGTVLLRIHRPFSWINSRIFISIPASQDAPSPDDAQIGEVQQEWHVYRRRYNHFVSREGEMEQFGTTDAGLLAWDFPITNEKGEPIGSINRNFSGFARELFTDTGCYVCRFEGVADERQAALQAPDSQAALTAPDAKDGNATAEPTRSETATPATSLSSHSSASASANSSLATTSTDLVPANLPSITYDQRAVMLAAAITTDFDYFSRNRGGVMGGTGMGMWMPFPMGGGSAEPSAPAPVPSSESEPSEVGEGGQMEGLGGEGDYPEVNRDAGGWSEEGNVGWGNETMQDPWAQPQSAPEEGGTWGWGDLFPGDD